MNSKNKYFIDEIMASVDKMEKASPDPYFKTRLLARMENYAENSISGTITYALVLASVLLLTFNFILLKSSKQESTDINSDTELFSKTYHLTSNTANYDINIQK